MITFARTATHTGGLSATIPTASSANCWSQLVLGVVTEGVANRQARVYFNDVANDSDDDGLGLLLETEIDTCDIDSLGEPDCGFSQNPADSDADGLPDGLEVLGGSHTSLALPRWGADPRHKDYFIEVDWSSTQAAQGHAVGTNPMTAALADLVIHPFAQGKISSIDNPDGTAGVAMHIDMATDSCVGGVCCSTDGLNCSASNGSWGGAGQVATDDRNASSLANMVSQRREYSSTLSSLRGEVEGLAGGASASA